MKLAENESRLVGMKFKALVELSQERSDAGFETQVSEAQRTKTCRLNLINLDKAEIRILVDH